MTLYALTLLSAFPSHTMAFAVVLLAVTLLTLAARTRISLGNNRYSRHLIIAAVRTRTFVRTSSPCLKALAVVLLALCFGAVALDDFLWYIFGNFLFNWWLGLNCWEDAGRGYRLVVVFERLLFGHAGFPNEFVVEVAGVDVLGG